MMNQESKFILALLAVANYDNSFAVSETILEDAKKELLALVDAIEDPTVKDAALALAKMYTSADGM